jgi:uncharacterized protein DUF6496
MPGQKTRERARTDAREGKAASTQAGEFVHEEIEHIREGKHGARSAKQAIAIGLSKARRAGVKVPPPQKAKTRGTPRAKAASDYARGRKFAGRTPSPKRSRAITSALQRESTQAASRSALSRQARASAQSRGAANRSRAAQQAVRTKGKIGLRNAARKAARKRIKQKS